MSAFVQNCPNCGESVRRSRNGICSHCGCNSNDVRVITAQHRGQSQWVDEDTRRFMRAAGPTPPPGGGK